MATAETVKAQLQADIAAANAATGKADATMHDAVASLIEGFGGGGGEKIYFSPHGVGYFANMVLDCRVIVGGAWSNANDLKSLELTEWNPTGATNLNIVGASLADAFKSTSLEKLLLPKLQYSGHYWARYATALKTVQVGSIGFPVNGGMARYFLFGCTQNDLTITVYVDATTFEEIPKSAIEEAPWGATNATIIYRNSTTGEVITE